MQAAELTIWNGAEYKQKSRHIDLLARGDFSPIQIELDRLYPNSGLQVRAIPFLQRYVAELTGLYEGALLRRFLPSSTDQAVWQKLQAVYQASQINKAMVGAEKQLWTQNNYLGVVMPAGLGRVKVMALKPWQIDRIDIDDPTCADDPASWSRLRARIPAQVTNGNVLMGWIDLTRTEAWRDLNGRRVGIYAPDGSHPFGVVPVMSVLRVEADPGQPTPPVNEAVLNLQFALSCQAADNEHIIRHCAWPQKVIEGAEVGQLVEELVHGPDHYLTLVRSGDPTAPAPKLSVVQGQVPVTELVTFAEHQIRLYCAMLGLDPAAFLRVNTAVTASARLFSAQDRKKERDKIKPVLIELEQQMFRWVVAVLGLREPMQIPSMTVDVQFLEKEPASDPQAESQALTSDIKIGVDNPVDEVMRREGLGRTDATQRVEHNLKTSRDLGLLPPLGVPTDAKVTAVDGVMAGAQSIAPGGAQ